MEHTCMVVSYDLLLTKQCFVLLQAIELMRRQEGGGHIFNMDGAGADGSATPRFAAYGASKRGLAQLGKSLQVRMLRVLDQMCQLSAAHRLRQITQYSRYDMCRTS